MPVYPEKSIPFLIETTKTLIEIEPTMIQLTHQAARVDNGRGGLTTSGSPTTEPTPKARFFSETTPKEQAVIKQEGKELVVDWVLVGMPGDDIRENDTFVVAGVQYKVWNVHDDKRWQVKGLCLRA